MKICKECNHILPLESFGKHPKSADGLEYRCKECKNFLTRTYRENNRDVLLERRREVYRTHKPSNKDLLKRIWNCMNMRCNDENNYQYHRYGGRGIKIQWNSFEEFKKDMLGKFDEGLRNGKNTIDRIDNNGNYSKENCRFASHVEQSNNTRRNVFFDFEGEKQTLAQIARKNDINYKMLWKRVNKKGLSIERAIQEALK